MGAPGVAAIRGYRSSPAPSRTRAGASSRPPAASLSELFSAYSITLDADRASSAATNHALSLAATDLEYEVTRVKSPVLGRDLNPFGRGDGTYYCNGGNTAGGSIAIYRARPSFLGEVTTGYGSGVNNGEEEPEGPSPACFGACICAAQCFLDWVANGAVGYPDSCCNEKDIQTMLDCCLGVQQEVPEKRSWFISDCLGCKGEWDIQRPPPELCCIPTGTTVRTKRVGCYLWLDWGSISRPGVPHPPPRRILLPGLSSMPYDTPCLPPTQGPMLLQNWPLKEKCRLYLRWEGTTWAWTDCRRGGYHEGTWFGHFRLSMSVTCLSNLKRSYRVPDTRGQVVCQQGSHPAEDLDVYVEGMLCPTRIGAVGIFGGGGGLPKIP